MTTEEILISVDTFIKADGVFNLILRKNPILYSDRIPLNGIKYYWFEYNTSDIVWIGQPIIDETNINRGDFFYIFISDFKFVGDFCYHNPLNQISRIPINLNATIRVFKNPEYDIDISDNTNHVEVWDNNQKVVNLAHYYLAKEISGLDLMPYDFAIYTGTWSKIDKNSLNKTKQSHVTSYYYLQELVECYERIKHLLSMVLLNSNYSNKYTKIRTEMPPSYDSRFLYKISGNFKIYDRYYLMYSELTIESLYKYWERVGYYLFQFLKPNSNKVTDENLSLLKLIKELNKEYDTNASLNNTHFDWFVSFVLKRDSEFSKLVAYRHPFVHYKVDGSTGQFKGGLISTTLNIWNLNILDENRLIELESENERIKAFIIDQFNYCKIGFDHMLELIKLMPDIE